MASSKSFEVFKKVDELVSKPVLGSDGAASWQEFRKEASQKNKTISTTIGTVAPDIPLKKSDRLGNQFVHSFKDERAREERIRREAGDAPVGEGYTHFKRKINTEEIAAKKRAKLIEDRVRPDDVPYFLSSETFQGWKEDYVFTTRDRGTGYYWDGMDSLKRQLGLPVGGRVGSDGGETKNAGEGRAKNWDEKDDDNDKNETKKEKKKKKKRTKEKDVPTTVPPEDDPYNPMEQIANAIQRRNAAMRMPPASLIGGRGAGAGAESAQLAAAGWEEATDPASARTYYFCRSTGERRWDNPLSSGLASNTAAVVQQSGIPNETGKGNEASGAGDNKLSDGWSSATDPCSGKTYYYHTSGKTSWDSPTS